MADPLTPFGINLEAIRDRLRELEYFNSVETIQAGAQAMDQQMPSIPPAAFVSTAAETYAANRYASGGNAQMCTAQISILIAIPAQRADDQLADEVEHARKLVLLRLIGWTPEGAAGPIEAGSYKIRAITDGVIWCEWMMPTKWDLRLNAAP